MQPFSNVNKEIGIHIRIRSYAFAFECNNAFVENPDCTSDSDESHVSGYIQL